MIVGVDVTHVERIRALFDRYPSAEMRFFTERERSHCRGHSDPMVHFAGTFAAKEAVIKTLRLGRAAAWARRVEVVRDGDGAPTARVRDERFPEEIVLSISHDRTVAMAVAISPRPKAPERRPTEQIPRTDARVTRRSKSRPELQPNANLGRFLGPHLDREAIAPARHALTSSDFTTWGSDFP